MNRDFSRVMDSLDGIKSDLLQVVTYNTFEPRCVIILDKEPHQLLEGLHNLRNYTSKGRLAFPLVVTRSFVEKSLDVFPLEFLDICTSEYQNLYCVEDLLARLQFAKPDLLRQMERELKSKWLLTRLTVLEESPKAHLLAAKLRTAVNATIPILKGFCVCADIAVPGNFGELLEMVSDLCGIDLKRMEQWAKLDKADLMQIKYYLEILQNLINYMEAAE